MAFIYVIIPCYNVEAYLEQAVASVLGQPYKGMEVVLVDDGSPGKTPQLCDEIAEREPRVHVLHQENGGVARARNKGIEYVLQDAECRFVSFLDGDDCWCPDVITDELVRHLQTDWREDLVGFGGVSANNAMTRYSRKLSQLETECVNARAYMWRAHESPLGAKLLAVDVIKNWGIRFVPGQAYSEDKLFINHFCFLADTARFVNRSLHIYRNNSAGAMGSMKKMTAEKYYLQVVNGWLKFDEFLNDLSHRTQAVSTIGKTLAVCYLVEMVAEHIKRFGSMQTIMEVLKKHPLYADAESGELIYKPSREYDTNRLLFEHPIRFLIKYRIQGCIEWVLLRLKRISLAAALWEKKRYPLKEIQK